MNRSCLLAFLGSMVPLAVGCSALTQPTREDIRPDKMVMANGAGVPSPLIDGKPEGKVANAAPPPMPAVPLPAQGPRPQGG